MRFDSVNEYRTLERVAAAVRSYVRAEFPELDPATRIGVFMAAIADEMVAGCRSDRRKLAAALETVQSGVRLFAETSFIPTGNGGAAAGTGPEYREVADILRGDGHEQT